MGVNQDILDAIITRSVFLQRVAKGESARISAFLKAEVLPNLLDRLAARMARIRSRGVDSGPWKTRALREALEGFDSIVADGMERAEGLVKERLGRLVVAEAEWNTRVLNETLYAVDLRRPSIPMLRAIVTSQPFEGRILRDHFRSLEAATGEAIARQVRIGLAQGDTVEDMVARVRGRGRAGIGGVWQTTTRGAEAVVRTAVNHVANQARATTVAESGIIARERFVATLDARTTPICRALDGQVFPVGEGPQPPMHYGCRSTRIPIVPSLAELGIPGAKKREIPEGTRASIDGALPASETYGTWLKRQSEARQNEILGPRRAAIFRRGRLTLDRFIDDQYRPLTVEELVALEARQ